MKSLITKEVIDQTSAIYGFFIIDLDKPYEIKQIPFFKRIKDHEILIFLRKMTIIDSPSSKEILDDRYQSYYVIREHAFYDFSCRYNSSLKDFHYHDLCHLYIVYKKEISILRQLSPKLIEDIVQQKAQDIQEMLQIHIGSIYWVYMALLEKYEQVCL